MPRIPEDRPAALPSSPLQHERYQRMLEATVRLGMEQEYDRVQMQDIAAEADVAIATLYRYFPSKVHLFVAVMVDRVDRAAEFGAGLPEGVRRQDAVAQLLISFSRVMLAERMLSLSVLQAVNLAQGIPSIDIRPMQDSFRDLVLGRAGLLEEASADDQRRAWLVVQCWFGVLMTLLNGRRSWNTSVEDIERACELLLG